MSIQDEVVLANVIMFGDTKRLKRIMDELTKMDEICSLHMTTGSSNLSAKVVANNIQEFHRILHKKIRSIHGVNVIKTDVITGVPKVEECHQCSFIKRCPR